VSFAPLHLLPAGVVGIAKEVLRHLLRRPVVGLAVFARRPAASGSRGSVVLIRRGDTGTWALPGGTVEWGETLTDTLPRELAEEAGVDQVTFVRVSGVYSRPDRDPRFHAVTVVVVADVGPIVRPPKNPLEIREAREFPLEDLPRDMAMTMRDYVDDVLRGGDVRFE
jgi:8-oxo-dGTP diphosphatase